MEKINVTQTIPKKQIVNELRLEKELGGKTNLLLFISEDGIILVVNFEESEEHYEKTIEDYKEALRIFNYIHQKPSKKYLKTIGFEELS